MPFLQKIDELFEASCLQFSVPLKSDNFHTYIPIEIYNDTHRFQFLIRKGKKSKILILAGQQRVYLTDDQIIRTILSMEDNETEWFLAQFISLYVGNGVQTTLELDKTKCAYRLYAVERKIDVKVQNIGQQKCYNDLRKRRRSLTWRMQRRSRFRSFAPDSVRKTPAGQNYSGFGFQTASSVRNAAVRNITQFAGEMRSSAAPAGIKHPSRLGRSCTAHICR